MPTLGGKLTILNCFLWAIVSIGMASDLPMLTLPAYVTCWPLALLLFLIPAGTPDPVLVSIIIGANSLVWGYSIAWFVTLIRRWRDRRGEVRRGFAVIPLDDNSSPPAAEFREQSNPTSYEKSII